MIKDIAKMFFILGIFPLSVFIFAKYSKSTASTVLFVVSLLLIVYLSCVSLRVLRIRKVLLYLKDRYGDLCCVKNVLLPVLFLFRKYVVISSGSTNEDFIIIFVDKRTVRYHFDTSNSVEIYVSVRQSLKTGKEQYAIGRTVVRLVKKINFPEDHAEKITYLFSKAPMDITTADKRANSYLTHGDVFFDNCRVDTVKSFINKEKE